MFFSLKARYSAAREQGFTLTELVVAILIAGILAAIALPVFLNAQKSVSALDVKTGLVQAANLVEAEKGDNNQLYPTYMPNEVLQNDLWKNFHYAIHLPDRLSYCMMGQDSNGGQWYVSATIHTPTSSPCYTAGYTDADGNPLGGTDANGNPLGGGSGAVDGGSWVPGKNSTPPWTIEFPKVDVSTYNLNWAANASKPTGSITWSNASCNVGNTSYQLHLVNSTQGIDVKVPSDSQVIANNGGLSGASYAPDLSGWLPSDATTVSVAAVCTETLGTTLYTYVGPYNGASKSLAVPQFPLPNSGYAAAPAAYYVANADKSLTMKVNATFSNLTCPVLTSGITGVNAPVYELIAKQAGKTDAGKGTFSSNPAVTLTLAGFAPDAQITYEGRSYCQFTRSSGSVARFSGTNTSDANMTHATNDGHSTTTEFSPVGFPSAPGKPSTVSTNGGTVKPDGLAWSAPADRACSYGGTLQYSYVQSAPGNSASAYSAGATSGLINFAQATNYTYYVNAKCVGTNRTSDVTSGPSVTFTTSAITPAATWKTKYTTSYSSGQLLANGSLNTISCPNNSAVRYFVKASQSGENDVTYDGVSPSPTLYLNTNNNANNGFNGDQLVTYTGYGYCRVTQYDNTTKDWNGSSASSTEYAAVANSNVNTNDQPWTSINGDPDTNPNQLNWNGAGCPNGGSIRYRYIQAAPGNSTSGWISGTSVANIGWNPGTTYTYHVDYQCAGNNRTSDIVWNSNRQFFVNWNGPHTPSAPSGIWTDQYGYSGVTTPNRVLWYSVGCDRAATPDYFVREVRVGGNYRNPEGGGYNDSGWLGNTTNFNVPDSWLRQGSQIGYQVTARCVGPGGTSDYNHGWSGERADVTYIPNAQTTSAWRNGDRHLNWNGVGGCGQGAYVQYYFQQWYHNDGQWGSVEGGWGVYYDANVDGYNGYTQGNRVYTRCAGDNATSGNSQSGDVNWQIPVYGPSVWFVCKPGSTASGKASSGNVSYCNNTSSGNYKKQVAFTLTCADNNPAWNGGTYWQGGRGIYVNQGSGLSAGQLANGRNTGDGTWGATGSATNNAAGGYTWGANWNVSANDAYCAAGNGAQSGHAGRQVNSGVGLDN